MSYLALVPLHDWWRGEVTSAYFKKNEFYKSISREEEVTNDINILKEMDRDWGKDKLSYLSSTSVIVFCLLFLFVSQVRSQPVDIRVHDPVMIKQGNTYYVFCTGPGITVYSSPDMKNWKHLHPVFSKAPDWTQKVVPGFRNFEWAPDISYHNGKYYLYYAVSAFGKNTSAIGLATNTTLDPGDPNFHWKDLGYVIRSIPGRDLWNAIDPNLIVDGSGTAWLDFGSFWHGIKLVKMAPDLTHIAKPQVWHTLASRARDWKTPDARPGKAAIEAPFIFQKGNYYYLFVSFDYCCRGVNSNYKVMVGRSESVTGPYVDEDGVKMRDGGGTLLLKGNKEWPGVGHEGVYTFDGKDYIIFHGYDASDHGKSKLWIEPLKWDKNGWPEASLKE